MTQLQEKIMKVEETPNTTPASVSYTNAETAPGPVPAGQVIPNGEAVAAMIAAGIGGLSLGFFTTLAEITAGTTFRTGGFPGLTWNTGVGPLSGKTGYAVIIWLIAWAVLHFMWRGREFNFGRMFWITLGLIGLGVLGTFPIFFQLFAA
jgi:hypothetical protein